MRNQRIAWLGVASLLILSAACSEGTGDTQAESAPASSSEDLVDETQGGAETQAESSAMLARLEGCGVDADVEGRIRELEQTLAELRLRFTDRHPEVASTMATLDRLVMRELSDCVEGLQ